MPRKAQLDILIVIGLILVIVTAWACGWHQWGNFSSSLSLFEVAALSALFGWRWPGQLRALFASGANRAVWIAWTVLIMCLPLLVATALTLFIFFHFASINSSASALMAWLKGDLRVFLPVLVVELTALLVGKRIDESYPSSRVFQPRHREPK